MAIEDRRFVHYFATRPKAGGVDSLDGFLMLTPGSDVVQLAPMGQIASATATLYPPDARFGSCSGGMQGPYVDVIVETASPTGPVELVIDPGGSEGIEVNLGGDWRIVPSGTRIQLTPGTAAVPLQNHVYAEWTGSTIVYQVDPGGWPETEHWRIASVALGSAADAFGDPLAGILGLTQGESWLCDGQALLAQLTAAIQARPPVYHGGGEVSFTGSGTNTLRAGVAAVEMTRLRPVTTTAAPAPARFFVPARSWIHSDILGGPVPAASLITLRDGTPITSNRYAVVTIGVAAADNGAQDHFWLGLPSGQYSDLALAKSDASGYGDYSIPGIYRGTGVLVARAVIRLLTAPSTTWTVEHLEQIAVTGIGGGSSAPSVTRFFDSVFRVISAAAPAAELALDLSGLAAGTTTLSVPPSAGGVLITLVNPPSSPTDPGEPGQIAIAGGYLYVYIATLALWGRAALSTTW